MESIANSYPDILVVDDNLQNLKLLFALLDREGYQARPVNNGSLALRAVEAAPPDLILLDINMPEMDGYEVCKSLKRNPDTRDIPIIFLSAYQNIEDKLTAFQAGGVDYVTKPFSKEEVLARVEAQLRIVFLQHELKEQNILLRNEIAEREKAQTNLRKLAQAVNFSGTPIVITDLAGTIEFVNAAFSAVTGYTAEDAIGQTPRILKSGKTDAAVYAEMWKTLAKGNSWRGDLLNRRKNGELYWDHMVISPITDENGKTTHYVAVRSDVTERKIEEQRLAHLATHDVLTGLPNRAFFLTRLEHAIALAKRAGTMVAVLFVDLDDFKTYNDRYGHSVGDEILCEFGQRLRTSLRTSDTLARFGGDEFVCLLENVANESSVAVVIEKILKEIEKPIVTAYDGEILISASIGVSIFPHDDSEANALIEMADTAMYRAKENRRENNYMLYSSRLKKSQENS